MVTFSARARRRLTGVATVCLGLLAGGCNDDGLTASCGIPVLTATPSGGLFPENEQASIRLESDRQAEIFFTLDGTPPKAETADCRNGPTFCGQAPISNIPIVFDGMKLQYFAIDNCGNQSRVLSSIYRLDRAPVTVADPPPGLYNANLSVNLTASDEATAPATIFWTTDGSDPVAANNSTQQGASPAAVSVNRSLTLKWAAEDSSGNREAIKTGQYTIDTVPPESVAIPGSGVAFDGPVDVLLKIDNDTGTLFYTLNGAEPVENDSNGHTFTASLQTTLTLDKSSFLRFTSVDKAGNLEHDPDRGDVPPLFNQEVYIINNRPAIVATPPGGTYTDSQLDIVLSFEPAQETTVLFSVDGSDPPTTPYAAGDVITISGSEGETIELRALASRNGGEETTLLQEYELGVAGVTVNFTETFSNLTFIDTDETTAKIDLSAQKAVLPDLTVELQDERIHDFPVIPPNNLSPIIAADAWAAAVEHDALILPRTVAVIDGALPIGSINGADEQAAGLKFYQWTDDDAASVGAPDAAYYVSAPVGTDPSQILAIEFGGITNPYAAAINVNNELLLFDLTALADPMLPVVRKNGDLYRQFGPKVDLLAPVLSVSGTLFSTGQEDDAEDTNTVIAWQVDPVAPSITMQSKVTSLTVGNGSAIVALAFDSAEITPPEQVVLALTVDCQLFSIDFSVLTAPVTSLVNDAICPGTATDMKSEIIGFQPHTFIAYQQGGLAELAVITGQDFANPRLGVLDDSDRPGGNAWSMALLTGLTSDLLALSGGPGGPSPAPEPGVYLYDLSDPGASVYAFEALISPSDEDFDVDGLATVANSDGNLLIGSQRNPSVITPSGGFALWNIADSPDIARVQSTNFNVAGSSVTSLKLESIEPDNAVVRFSTDGVNFDIGPVGTGQVKSINNATQVFWQSILSTGNDPTETTELDSLTIRVGSD